MSHLSSLHPHITGPGRTFRSIVQLQQQIGVKLNQSIIYSFSFIHLILLFLISLLNQLIRFILGNTEYNSSYSSLNLSFLCRSSKWKDKRFNAHIVDLYFLINQAFRHTSNQSMRVKSFLADTVDTKQQLKGAFIHT